MNPPKPGNPELAELFFGPASDQRALAKRFHIVKRRGRLLLALPANLAETGEAMDLYPAQKPLARSVKAAIQFAARLRIPLPFPSVEQSLNGDSAFLDFLERLAPGSTSRDRGLAILAGNPNSPGRRFVLLLFHQGHPAVVVKTGVKPDARELIRRETAFLQSTQRPGVERVVAAFESESVSALAVRHVAGSDPRLPAPASVRKTVEPWIDPEVTLALDAIPAWLRLAAACSELPLFARLQSALAGKQIHPAVFHGDFAPWNVKVHPVIATWQIFDWERGELRGMPGWDWLHFEIQPALLVRKEAPHVLLPRLVVLLKNPEFCGYLNRAGLEGLARPLTLAYLLYCLRIQRQTEGEAQIDALLQYAAREWNV